MWPAAKKPKKTTVKKQTTSQRIPHKNTPKPIIQYSQIEAAPPSDEIDDTSGSVAEELEILQDTGSVDAPSTKDPMFVQIYVENDDGTTPENTLVEGTPCSIYKYIDADGYVDVELYESCQFQPNSWKLLTCYCMSFNYGKPYFGRANPGGQA